MEFIVSIWGGGKNNPLPHSSAVIRIIIPKYLADYSGTQIQIQLYKHNQ